MPAPFASPSSSFIAKLVAGDGPFALFDDSLNGESWLFHDLDETIACHSPREIGACFARIDKASAEGRYVAIAASYELAYWLEPRILNRAYESAVPLLTAQVFRLAEKLSGDAVKEEIAAASESHAQPSGIAGLRRDMSIDHYLASVARILHHIHEGDCYQVNMTQPLRFEAFGSPLSLYAKLRAAQPVHYGAFLHTRAQSILCRSPELFMRRDGARITVRPMKGTAPRSADAGLDAEYRDSLTKSDKERAENLMIVDLLRNDLGRIATTGSVTVDKLFEVEPYPTVWQMTSSIHAEVPAMPLEAVFRALFPCGSVTGAPKIKAMEIISLLESSARDLYCGALGFMLPSGDFRFAVPIRTMVLTHGERGTRGVMNIGSGIVADSDPVAEARECDLKAAFLLKIDPGFALLESLLLDPADALHYPLLPFHLARLANSATHFGFACDEAAIRQALLKHADTFRESPCRKVRLTLAKSGAITVDSEPIGETPTGACIFLADEPLDSRDPLRAHKTTSRRQYDHALARALAQHGGFDALFVNERGELAEGARSNLVLKIGNEWLTPPLSAGLLPGAMRAKLLAGNSPKVIERTLTVADLERATEIWAVNAVRGMVKVRYAGLLPPG